MYLKEFDHALSIKHFFWKFLGDLGIFLQNPVYTIAIKHFLLSLDDAEMSYFVVKSHLLKSFYKCIIVDSNF